MMGVSFQGKMVNRIVNLKHYVNFPMYRILLNLSVGPSSCLLCLQTFMSVEGNFNNHLQKT